MNARRWLFLAVASQSFMAYTLGSLVERRAWWWVALVALLLIVASFALGVALIQWANERLQRERRPGRLVARIMADSTRTARGVYMGEFGPVNVNIDGVILTDRGENPADIHAILQREVSLYIEEEKDAERKG